MFEIIISVIFATNPNIYILTEWKVDQTLGRFSALGATFSQFLGNGLSSGCREEDCAVPQTTQRTEME